ncbi:hypothetical protein WN51_11483 [Melipona quadrifasciata]|uniref:Uncharacterized protein n=1 Tax=Melipona quadrifasciata TaxID=166423 RepID=A0A0N0BK26_9HYME|nr:hypothetical protein WN51_11483 [Melipona quadrifasciata]
MIAVATTAPPRRRQPSSSSSSSLLSYRRCRHHYHHHHHRRRHHHDDRRRRRRHHHDDHRRRRRRCRRCRRCGKVRWNVLTRDVLHNGRERNKGIAKKRTPVHPLAHNGEPSAVYHTLDDYVAFVVVLVRTYVTHKGVYIVRVCFSVAVVARERGTVCNFERT